MSETVTATDEQSTGIEQINRAISEIDAVTQHDAALVEQVAAASGAAGILSERPKINRYHV